ncbi:MAG: protoporphyrinogen oxidase, partial [Proteobacteria bacterium]|nr:protoporphyrinogen oxidase [Pseudomonadota bacterium]
MKESEKTVAIIGGGIAGLSAAYHLHVKTEGQGEAVNYFLVEGKNRLGGNILTETIDGFIIEGGPDCFISEKPATIALCHKLGIQDRLMKTNERCHGTFILWKGKLHKLPDGFMLLAPTNIPSFLKDSLITPWGKFRMALDFVLPAKKSDEEESLAQFVRRRLGKEVLDKIADPLVAGVHASDPATMSLKSTFPRFIELENHYRSVIRGMMKRRKKYFKYKKTADCNPQYTLFMTLKEGVSELTNALASALRPEAVFTGHKALAIEKIPPNTNGAAGRYSIKLTNGKTLKAHAVIVATPSYIAADLLKGQDIPLAENLASIPYVSTATVSLAYRGEDIMKPLNGFGFVIPRLEQRKIMASTWSSNKFFNRAPKNKFLIRCFAGGAGNEHLSLLSEPEIAAIVRDELRDIMGIKAEPIFTKVYRWKKSMPQY